jgi:hypothetical protein
MALTPRQRRLYDNEMTIKRKSRGTSGDIKVTTVATAVKCKLFNTDNADEPTTLGMMKQDVLVTYDFLHCEYGTDIRGEDEILFTKSGKPGYGDTYVVRGDPAEYQSSGGRRANYSKVYINLSIPANTA